MEQETDEAVPSGFAGFFGDLLWEIGQIGQALLDGVTVVLVGLLIYQHGAVLNTTRHAADPVAVQRDAPRPVPCASGLSQGETCIQAQVLEPSAS